MSPCFLPLFLLHSDMWMLIFSYCSWVFPLLHPTVSGSVSLPWLPPCPSSWSVTRKLWTAPTVGFPSFSSPECSFPHPLPSYLHLSLFFSSQPTVPVSLPCNFLSLPFPVKPAITSSFPSLPLFPCDFEPDHSFHSRLSLVKRALGAERCVNLCSSPEQPGTLVIKKVIFLLWPELLQIARFLFMDIGKLWVFH